MSRTCIYLLVLNPSKFYPQVNKIHFNITFLQLHMNYLYVPDFYCKFLFVVLGRDPGLPASADVKVLV